MTQEEILEYNKRCAVFLGWKETSEQFKIDWCGCKTKERLEKINKQYIPILEKDGDVLFPDFNTVNFYSDWNWIMEVLSKIEESHHTIISQGITGHYVNINREDVNILTQTLDNPSKFMGSGKTKKEAVVQAINQFLIWYNEHTSKS